MRADQARQIPIATVLDRAGVKPARVTRQGRELWYSSPLRSGDTNPSFKVDVTKNLWFDHGLARGGNVIDLVIEMRKVTVKEALAILESGFSGSVPAVARLPSMSTTDEKEKGDGAFEIVDVREIEHPALVSYLASRCIPLTVARRYLKELRFRTKVSPKQYFALGFQSGGGYDARSPVFKGFIGQGKDVSALNFADKGTVAVFEGQFDFLSWLSWRGLNEPDCGVIVLNSVALRKRAVVRIREHGFGRVMLYLDRDGAGVESVKLFRVELADRNVVDGSALYDTYKDIAEWWVRQQQS
jgi:hypothetical protein